MRQPSHEPVAVPAGLDIPLADWQQTPPSGQTLVVTVLQRLEALEARVSQDSRTSQRPPSADSPSKKPRKAWASAPPRQAGGQPGHPGHRQWLLPQTETRMVMPPQCACGQTAWAMTRAGAEALVVLSSPLFVTHAKRIAELAVEHRLPGTYEFRGQVVAGGLMLYNASGAAIQQRVASYVDRILKGTKPADLPVEQPTTFELVINLKTAKALGITIPPTLLFRVDEVIQ